MKTNGKTYPIVLKETGNLLWMLGFVFIIPGIISALYGEWYSASGFILSALITMASGQALRYLNRSSIYDVILSPIDHALHHEIYRMRSVLPSAASFFESGRPRKMRVTCLTDADDIMSIGWSTTLLL